MNPSFHPFVLKCGFCYSWMSRPPDQGMAAITKTQWHLTLINWFREMRQVPNKRHVPGHFHITCVQVPHLMPFKAIKCQAMTADRCSQFPRGARVPAQTALRREAPGPARRREGRWRHVGRSLYCGFCGKKWVRRRPGRFGVTLLGQLHRALGYSGYLQSPGTWP